MADNALSVNGVTVRSKDVGSGVQAEIVLAGAHVRTYDGIQSLSLSGSSQSLTVPGSSTHAEIIAESATSTDYARFWPDGTAPTASVGMQLAPGQAYDCASPSTFKVIVGAGTLTLRIAYYHYA